MVFALRSLSCIYCTLSEHMVAVTNRCGLLDIIENNYSSGFRCNRIQTIPGIEFPCGNWILRSIRVNTVVVQLLHSHNIPPGHFHPGYCPDSPSPSRHTHQKEGLGTRLTHGSVLISTSEIRTAESASPRKCSISTRPFSSREAGVWGHD